MSMVLKFSPQCKGLGIGSLPLTDPQAAIKLVRKNLPVIPHWPQLPGRGRAEHFIYQCLNSLVELGLVILEDEHIYFDEKREDWEEKLTEFYSKYLTAREGEQYSLDWFFIPHDSAVGFYAFLDSIKKDAGATEWVKGQLAGPLSVALNITNREKKPAYYNSQMKDILVKALAMQARWQAEKLTRLGYPAMVFVDDPALAAVGVSTYITLDREQVVGDLKEIADEIHAGQALAGAHSCAAVDWSMFIEAGFDIISFDAYEYYESLWGHVEALHGFLKRGGALAWGIVPTSYKVLGEDVSGLRKKLEVQVQQLANKGIPEELLYSQILIAPSCGAGTLSVEEAEKIYELIFKLSAEMHAG